MDIWSLNLRHLRAICEISRFGSISAAADAVALTQPAVTQGVARLERQFGLSLFERRAKGMLPSPAAALLAPRIERALAHIASPRVTMAQMRALIALGHAGSYAGASLECGLSEPSLHRAVKDLSVALRRTLVERRGRGVALTESGHRTARAFRLARAELLAGLSEIEGLTGRQAGRVAIGAMPLSRARLLPEAVTAFHRDFPEVEIVIAEGSHAELIEPLRDGELDLLIGALREPLPGDDIVQHALFDDHPVVLARAGHPLDGAADPAKELTDYPWIVASPGTPLRIQWERMFTARNLPIPRVPIECGSVMTIRQILRNSDFLTLLSPDQVAVELDAGLLVQLCPAPGETKRTIGMTTRAGWHPTATQRAFVDRLCLTAGLPKSYSI